MLDPLLLFGLRRKLFAQRVEIHNYPSGPFSTTIVYNQLSITTGLCIAMLVINKYPLRFFVTCQENGCLSGLEGSVVINIWSIEVGCEQGSIAGFGDR